MNRFVQVAVASIPAAGECGDEYLIVAVDDDGRAWKLWLGGDGWSPLPGHPENPPPTSERR